MAEEPKKKATFDGALVKGFLAGVLFSHINKRLMLGFIAGVVGGAYIQQNYDDLPDVEATVREWFEAVRSNITSSSSGKKS